MALGHSTVCVALPNNLCDDFVCLRALARLVLSFRIKILEMSIVLTLDT